jgi:hypothetical protein
MAVPVGIIMFLNVTPCSLVFADVLEQGTASIFRVKEKAEQANKQLGL